MPTLLLALFKNKKSNFSTCKTPNIRGAQYKNKWLGKVFFDVFKQNMKLAKSSLCLVFIICLMICLCSLAQIAHFRDSWLCLFLCHFLLCSFSYTFQVVRLAVLIPSRTSITFLSSKCELDMVKKVEDNFFWCTHKKVNAEILLPYICKILKMRVKTYIECHLPMSRLPASVLKSSPLGP